MDDRPIAATYSYRRSPFTAHSIILLLLLLFVSTGSVSHQNLFIGPRALEAVHGTRTPSTVITFIKSGAAVDGPGRARRPSWTPKSRRGSKFYERNGGVVGPDPAIPLAILPTTGCGQRVQTDGSGSGERGGCGGEFRTGPSGNSPSTGSQNAMVPRFRGTWSPSSKMNPLECGFYRSIARGMLISEVILFDDR